MKKIILLLGILSILLIDGCQKPQSSNDTFTFYNDRNRLYVTLSYSEGQYPTNCTRNDFYGSFIDTQNWNWMYNLAANPLKSDRPHRTVYANLDINQWECRPRDNNGIWCDCYIKSEVDTTNVFDGR